MRTLIDVVAQNTLTHFGDVVHPQVVRIFTPFGQRIPLNQCRVSDEIKRFIEVYEPKVKSGGLFQHQASFLQAFSQHPERHFLLTTSSGLGKSLCFWIWVFEHLCKDTNATALLCFPTQALMWSQVERLARLSEPKSLAFPGKQKTAAYGGTVQLMNKEIGWTVWYGHGEDHTLDELMDEHEKSDMFKLARIRVATIDKAHWSLIRQHKEFVARLRCIVLDEVHTYSGIFGANVHFFLRRLLMSQELLRSSRKKLRFFLASATLSNAKEFVQKLIPLDSKDPDDKIEHIQDVVQQEISLITAKELQNCLAHPPADGLLRLVVLGHIGWDKLKSFMSSEEKLGTKINAIFFSPSKFTSRLMKLEMQQPGAQRDIVIYDADIPPPERRAIERKLNDPSVQGVTVLATSAMEVGVDIEGLDLCILSRVPPTKIELLQQIGRVGRRVGKPGLAIVPISQKPHSERILENPVERFRLDQGKIIPVPTHLEILELKHILAVFREWRYKHEAGKKINIDWDLIIWKLSEQFDLLKQLLAKLGLRPEMLFVQSESRFKRDSRQQKLRDALEGLLENLFNEVYSEVIEMSDPDWVFKGFRGTGTYLVPLLDGEKEVARVNQMDVFRDAHPEAVYLGHDSNFYRIVAYEVDSRKSMSPFRWLKSIKTIRVKREERYVTTRGEWDDQYEPLDCKIVSLPNGNILVGTWIYTRKWQGYREIDLAQNRERFVSLGEVVRRFQQAIAEGDDFPFLHPLTYRTLGWRWDFGPLGTSNEKLFNFILERLLSGFIADSVESNEQDMIISLDLDHHHLYVLDSTPGGNGLSYALLQDNRLETALQRCLKKLSQFQPKTKRKEFENYVREMCYGIQPSYSLEMFLETIQELYARSRMLKRF